MSIRRQPSSPSSASPPSPSYGAPLTHRVGDVMCSGAHRDEADEAIRQMSLQVRQRFVIDTTSKASYVFL